MTNTHTRYYYDDHSSSPPTCSFMILILNISTCMIKTKRTLRIDRRINRLNINPRIEFCAVIFPMGPVLRRVPRIKTWWWNLRDVWLHRYTVPGPLMSTICMLLWRLFTPNVFIKNCRSRKNFRYCLGLKWRSVNMNPRMQLDRKMKFALFRSLRDVF
jgi:hypothetical protein